MIAKAQGWVERIVFVWFWVESSSPSVPGFMCAAEHLGGLFYFVFYYLCCPQHSCFCVELLSHGFYNERSTQPCVGYRGLIWSNTFSSCHPSSLVLPHWHCCWLLIQTNHSTSMHSVVKVNLKVAVTGVWGISRWHRNWSFVLHKPHIYSLYVFFISCMHNYEYFSCHVAMHYCTNKNHRNCVIALKQHQFQAAS